eukprot:3350221-Rhodomonas_salina.1
MLVIENWVVQPDRLAFPKRPDPDSRSLKIPPQKRPLQPSIRVGGVHHIRMLARELPDRVAAERVEVSVQIRTESVPLQQDPRWGVALAWPVIVDPTELSHGPGPET